MHSHSIPFYFLLAREMGMMFCKFAHGDTDTNMYVERYVNPPRCLVKFYKILYLNLYLIYIFIHYHTSPPSFCNHLKTVYSNGKVNSIIDALLDILLKTEHN